MIFKAILHNIKSQSLSLQDWAIGVLIMIKRMLMQTLYIHASYLIILYFYLWAHNPQFGLVPSSNMCHFNKLNIPERLKLIFSMYTETEKSFSDHQRMHIYI